MRLENEMIVEFRVSSNLGRLCLHKIAVNSNILLDELVFIFSLSVLWSQLPDSKKLTLWYILTDI